MSKAFQAFLLSAVAIVAAWWWLGRPVAMPVAPLAPGDKLDCISYAPFRGGETPLDLSLKVEPWRIEEDLKRLAPLTNCVRTYSVHQGLDQVAPIAQRLGLKVMLGIWLGRDPVFNANQIEVAVATANRYPDAIRAVVVGNEVMLRGELPAATLADTIRAVKARVSMPVTYADVWEFWLRNRDLVNAVDFVTIHILPYWEDFPIAADKAADHVMSIRRQVAQSFPGKDIMIGEFGWPSAGRMREGALPSPSNQAKVFQEVIARAKQEKFALNVIEAFDQPWKRQFEGTVGGHWGLLDGDTREPKFRWAEAVSDHPRWVRNAVLGVLLAALTFGAGLYASRRDKEEVAWPVWIAVAAAAAVSGTLLGWAVEQAMVESFGTIGALRSAALVAVAASAPALAAVAMLRGIPLLPFSNIVGRRAERVSDPWTWAAGLVLAASTVLALQAALGLVFDPRYRDFPFAPLTSAVVPFGLLAARTRGGTGRRAAAETAAAATLVLSAVYIAFNEGFENWQALWFCAAIVVLAAILRQARDAPG